MYEYLLFKTSVPLLGYGTNRACWEVGGDKSILLPTFEAALAGEISYGTNMSANFVKL
jgi:hypothetical protein